MKAIKYVLPLAILNLIALILVTLGLPDIVPLHINIFGAIDSFGSKWFIPIIGMIPVLIAVIYIIYTYYLQSDLNKEIENKIIPTIAIIFIPFTWILVILSLKFSEAHNYLHPSTNFASINIIVFVLVILALLFIFISFYLENLKQNWYIGIRTPWTHKNELVWKKTHKLGKYTFRIGGILLLIHAIAVFLTFNFFYAIIGLIMVIIIIAGIPILYSYKEYKKIKK